MNLSPRQKRRARALRQRMTPTEKKIWALLRSRRFAGVKFRRQHPFGSYTVDFFCDAAKVVLELDGESHVGKAAYDERRRRWLEAQGLRVIRIWDTEVYGNFDGVIAAIQAAVSAVLSPSGRGPRRTE